MKKVIMSFGLVLGSLFLIALIACILALPTQLLWNYCLAPAINGVHEIGFIQALGLNILFSILFKVTIPANKTFNKEK